MHLVDADPVALLGELCPSHPPARLAVPQQSDRHRLSRRAQLEVGRPARARAEGELVGDVYSEAQRRRMCSERVGVVLVEDSGEGRRAVREDEVERDAGDCCAGDRQT